MLSFLNPTANRHLRQSLTFHLVIAGDSIANGTVEVYADVFKAELAAYGINAIFYDGAQGGLELDTFWDVPTNTKAAGYDTKWSDVFTTAEKNSINAFLLCVGTNDLGEVAENTEYSGEEFEAALEGLAAALVSDPDYPNLDVVFMRPMGRYTTNNSEEYHQPFEDIRLAHYNAAADSENIVMMPGFYDLDLADSVHPAESGYRQLAKREAAAIAYHYGRHDNRALGIEVISGQVDDQGILLNITLDDGSDYTVPAAGEGVAATLIKTGSTELSFNAYERVSASQLRLKIGAPYSYDDLSVRTIEGSLFPLGLTDYPAVRETGALELPLIPKTVVITNPLRASDPILQMDPAYYTRPTFEKTGVSGNQFTGLKSVNGGSFAIKSGTNFIYDATAFDGAGGMSPADAATTLGGEGGLIDPSGGFLAGFVVEIDSVLAELTFFAFGTSSYGGFNTAQFYTRTANTMNFFRNISTAVVLDSAPFGKRYAIIVNLKADNTLDIYVNDGATPAVSTTSHGDIRVIDSLFFGGYGTAGNPNNIFGMAWGKSGEHNSMNDPSIPSLMTFMKGEYGVMV